MGAIWRLHLTQAQFSGAAVSFSQSPPFFHDATVCAFCRMNRDTVLKVLIIRPVQLARRGEKVDIVNPAARLLPLFLLSFPALPTVIPT